MKIILFLLFAVIFVVTLPSCKKDSFITSKSASLSISSDTLFFDTVFTTTGSITGYFKVFNTNNQKLLLSNVKLMGGNSSYFKLNLDGTSGTSFSNIEIAANDSLYGFVTVSINPNDSLKPFVERDSIQISYNGNIFYMQLAAYGQNAYFLKNTKITKDTTWNNKLPIVILGGVTVNSGAKLTIQKGTKIYVNANAPIIVNGTLQALGDTTLGRINFLSDRLDVPYNSYPGAWPGIYFNDSSINNILEYCTISNGYEGVSVLSPSINGKPKLILNQCILNNIYDVAIGGNNSTIAATNCLISNCGNNVSLTGGGTYSFDQCTIVSYDNIYISHKNGVFSASNSDSYGITNPLNCTVNNSILYGYSGLVDNEVVLSKSTSATFNVSFNNVFYKVKKAINPPATVNNFCRTTFEPAFDSVNNGTNYYNFKLSATSPCLKAGGTSQVLIDMEGHSRPTNTPPDLGCYQRKD